MQTYVNDDDFLFDTKDRKFSNTEKESNQSKHLVLSQLTFQSKSMAEADSIYSNKSAPNLNFLSNRESGALGRPSANGSRGKLTIDDFELQGILGEGSYGKVYCGKDKMN